MKFRLHGMKCNGVFAPNRPSPKHIGMFVILSAGQFMVWTITSRVMNKIELRIQQSTPMII